MNADPTAGRRFKSLWVKWISIGVILISLFLIVRALPLDQFRELLQTRVKEWGFWGPVFFGVIYAVAVVFLIPASLLTLAGGAIFGLVKGVIVISLASTTGAALAFLIARYLARGRVEARVKESPKLTAIDQAIGEQGWKIVALLRLSPAVPFTLQNYLYGVTAIRFWPCILTSWIAMLPGTFMYVYLGSLGSRAALGNETSGAEWTLRGVGLIATIAVTVYITHIAKRAMQERVEIPPGPEARHADEDVSQSQSPPSRSAAILWMVAATFFVIVAVVAQIQEHWLRAVINRSIS
jgi:uncharacterized membrane protein YdjX (TVP38/TMEM64 family)